MVSPKTPVIEKLQTGIPGFEHIADGGLPKVRTTLVTGTSGSAKTVFAAHFLAAGIREADEAGVFVTFEESPEDIRKNMLGFGWIITNWEAEKKWSFVDASARAGEELVVSGCYDLGALLVRVKHAISQTGAKRVSMDSLGAILSQLPDSATVRQELFRIAVALKDIGVTSVLTAERSDEYGDIARFGVEEYVADNVIILRNVLEEEKRRRTIEILKFRGTTHQRGEIPFTISTDGGVIVISLSSMELKHKSSKVRITSGSKELDQMCNGGFFRDSIVLVSGATGTGKTLTSTHFIAGGAANGQRTLLCAYEESREQLVRSAIGWGIDFEAFERDDRLKVICEYPERMSLEDHLIKIKRLIEEFKPHRFTLDSLSALERISTIKGFREFVIALTGYLKEREIAALFTDTSPTLMGGTSVAEANISTLTDSIVLLRYVEMYGEMRRGLTVLKMRGSMHDKEIREFVINDSGLHIGKPFRNVVGILTGMPSYMSPGELERVAGLFEEEQLNRADCSRSAEAPMPLEAETEIRRVHSQGIRVLLIEDNPGDIQLIQQAVADAEAIRAKPCMVDLHCAQRLSTGLERLKRGGIDLVLLDLALPDGQGLEVLAKVRAATREVPVVVLTASPREALALEALHMGAQDYLLKEELRGPNLLRTISYAVERQQLVLSMEQRLHQLDASEGRVRRIIEKDADGIVILDREGIVRFANPAAGSLFLRQPQELIGAPFGFPLVRDEAAEIDIIRTDGQRCIAEMRLVEIEWEGESAYLASLRDVTDRRVAETAAEERKQEIEELLHVLAHDLRHPLVSIQWLLNELEEDRGHALDGDVRENIRLALSECDRMKNLIADLSRVAKIGQTETEYKRVHLPTFVENRVSHYKGRIEGQEVTVDVECDDVEAVFCRDQVDEALDNLIENALNYGCSGAAACIGIKCKVKGSFVDVSIADSGPGIPPESHERVFKLFQRLGQNDSVEGSGVGLAAVRRLMKRIGGEVSLESSTGQGTRFTISFPVQAVE